MKNILLLIFLLPHFAFSQKVKINEYDKFIKQRRIELEPLPIMASESANVAITYNSIGSALYITLSGYGWGASTIDANNETIFLLSNDSTVTVKSTGLQMYNVGGAYNSYKHRYYITIPLIETLSKHDIVGIRKYTLNDFTDTKIAKPNATKIKKLSALFIEELKKANVIKTLKQIDIADIGQHIGDSVTFCSKIYSTSYITTAEDKPTLFNVGAGYPNHLLTAVIWEEDRKFFGTAPELAYNQKEVCINGVVELFNNKPQIVIHQREQISLKSPIGVEEAAHFVGDSISVYGRVSTVNVLKSDGKDLMLLNLGNERSHQLLTVIVQNNVDADLPQNPEKFFVQKQISVRGKITLVNGIPQLIVNTKDQIGIMTGEPMKKPANNGVMTAASVENVRENAAPVVTTSISNSSDSKVNENRTASFPGGTKAWQKFLENNLILSDEQGMVEGKKTVVVQFIVNADGNVSGIKIMQSAGKYFDNEVLKMLKKMPKWIPEIKDGQPVSVTHIQPISFSSN